jgi:hypothetical protein
MLGAFFVPEGASLRHGVRLPRKATTSRAVQKVCGTGVELHNNCASWGTGGQDMIRKEGAVFLGRMGDIYRDDGRMFLE